MKKIYSYYEENIRWLYTVYRNKNFC